MFENIQAVLFDLDGTLLDSAPDLGAAADKMRTDRRLASRPATHYRPYASSGARGMVYAAFGLEPEHPEYEALKTEFLNNYEARMNHRTRAFAGVTQLIERIEHSSLKWGVVTNKAKRFTDPLTKDMPLFSNAAVIVSGDTTAHSKPHPEPLLEAARQLKLDPTKCLYVGDDERDIQAGKAAGMPTVFAAYGYVQADADTKAWGADAEIQTPEELLKLLAHAVIAA